MMIPIWPTTLPQGILREGFTIEVPNNILESESDDTFSKRRPKGAPPPVPYTWPMYLTNAQFTILDNFTKYTLRNGVLRFSHIHPITEEAVELLIIPQSEKLFSYEPYGLGWKVSLKVKIMP